MAQGPRRPGRHSRQPSRLAAFVSGRGANHQDRKLEKRTDEATVAYVKSVLCLKAQPDSSNDHVSQDLEVKSLDELLPPLTSNNDIDVQLYALISVILNLFVQSWYNKFTPDQDFTNEVIQIIAHCTRGLEQRLRCTDLECLLLDDIPAILHAHIDAVDTARSNSYGPRRDQTMRVLYQSLRPHNALAPVPISPKQAMEQQENESAWCQLVVNHVLSLLLPPEDLQNPCLEVLVSEVFSEMIVHNGVCRKACEGWLILEGITKIIYVIRPSLAPALPAEPAAVDRLAQFGLLSTSGSLTDRGESRASGSLGDSIIRRFWSSMQLLHLLWLCIWSLTTALTNASNLPARTNRPVEIKVDEEVPSLDDGLVEPEGHEADCDRLLQPANSQPILDLSIWPCISRMIRLQQRMPWLTGFLALMRWLLLNGPGQVCCTDSRLDRLLSSSIRSRLLDPALLPSALQAVRSAIFPDNVLGPARSPPSIDDQAAIKRECARVIVELVPDYVRKTFFATDEKDAMRDDVEDMLGLLDDPYINKHLIFSIVELVVVRLFPETVEP